MGSTSGKPDLILMLYWAWVSIAFLVQIPVVRRMLLIARLRQIPGVDDGRLGLDGPLLQIGASLALKTVLLALIAISLSLPLRDLSIEIMIARYSLIAGIWVWAGLESSYSSFIARLLSEKQAALASPTAK